MSEGTHDGQQQARKNRDRISASKSRDGGGGISGLTTEAAAQPARVPPDPRSAVEKTVDDHPLALLAGSLVMGVVAATVMQSSLMRRLGSRVLGVVVVAGELGARAGNKTLGAAAEAGKAGQERLARLGDLVAEEGAEVRRRAAELGSQAGRRAIDLASEAAAEAREKGTHALDRIGKLGGKR